MVQRLTADLFSIDVYCTYLNSYNGERFIEGDDQVAVTDSSTDTIKPRTYSKSSIRHGRGIVYVVPRLIWLAIGPVALMMLSVLKLDARSSQAGMLDSSFMAVTAGLLVLRWSTWLAGDKYDSFGAKLSLKGLLGFSGLLTVTACVFWGFAGLLAEQH